MTWLAILFFIEGGLVNGANAIVDGESFKANQTSYYQEPEMSTYFDIGFELQLFNNHLFVGGGIENYQVPESLTVWQPHRAIYDFNAGARLSVFEIGVRHFCDHPVISSERLPTYVWNAQTKIYLKIEYTFNLIGGSK